MPVWSLPYNITDQDYIDFNEHFILNTPVGKKSVLTYRLLPCVIFFTATMASYLAQGDVLLLVLQLILFGVLSLFWWFISHRVILFSLKRRLKKHDSIERSLFSPSGILTFDFNSRTITDTTPSEEVKISFNSIHSVYETDTAYYFYYNKILMHVIIHLYLN